MHRRIMQQCGSYKFGYRIRDPILWIACGMQLVPKQRWGNLFTDLFL